MVEYRTFYGEGRREFENCIPAKIPPGFVAKTFWDTDERGNPIVVTGVFPENEKVVPDTDDLDGKTVEQLLTEAGKVGIKDARYTDAEGVIKARIRDVRKRQAAAAK